MTTNSSVLVPRSERAHFALQMEEQRTKLSFTEKCTGAIIVFSPYLILKIAAASLVLLIGKSFFSLMTIVSFFTAFLILPKIKEWMLQRKLTEVCRPLIEENTDDYLRSHEIEEALEQLTRPGPSLLSTTEPYLEGEWTPLCFEPELRPWIREELQEHFSEESCPPRLCIRG